MKRSKKRLQSGCGSTQTTKAQNQRPEEKGPTKKEKYLLDRKQEVESAGLVGCPVCGGVLWPFGDRQKCGDCQQIF